jgi:hypothetical protein
MIRRASKSKADVVADSPGMTCTKLSTQKLQEMAQAKHKVNQASKNSLTFTMASTI